MELVGHMEDLPGVLRVPKKIMMKRVRKEIRELKEWEWHNIVDAIWVMKGLSDIDGKAIYGPKFVSYDTMVGKHIAAGRTIETLQEDMAVIFFPETRDLCTLCI